MTRSRWPGLLGVALLCALCGVSCAPGRPPVVRGTTGPPGIARLNRAGHAAPTVYLHYVGRDGKRLPAGAACYLELTVRRTAPGASFTALGFGQGYLALRDAGPGTPQRALVFAVHDSPPNAPRDVDHAAVLFADPRTHLTPPGRGQSGPTVQLPLDWQPGASYRVLLTAALDEHHIAYTAYVSGPGTPTPGWVKLATIRTYTDEAGIFRPSSYVEDLARTGSSATDPRAADFANGWLQDTTGHWQPLDTARFTTTGGQDPGVHLDAAAEPRGFTLDTGGTTPNTTPLDTRLTATTPDAAPPPDLQPLTSPH